jgi:ABC-type iron transport system FetAB permease component
MKLKLPSIVSKMLNNKYVFYILALMSGMTILGYLTVGNIKAVIFFFLVGYLVHCFNKNKAVTLIVPLILTSVVASSRLIKEGMENKDKKATKASKETEIPDTVESTEFTESAESAESTEPKITEPIANIKTMN